MIQKFQVNLVRHVSVSSWPFRLQHSKNSNISRTSWWMKVVFYIHRYLKKQQINSYRCTLSCSVMFRYAQIISKMVNMHYLQKSGDMKLIFCLPLDIHRNNLLKQIWASIFSTCHISFKCYILHRLTTLHFLAFLLLWSIAMQSIQLNFQGSSLFIISHLSWFQIYLGKYLKRSSNRQYFVSDYFQ